MPSITSAPETALPKDFDGTFKFTNFTDKEFKAMWNSVEYTFPPMKTVPLIIPSATPLEVQNIRKKFAKELAIIEWYKTPKFIGMNAHVPGGTPALYTDKDLAPFIQRCLEPLPIAQVISKKIEKDDDAKFSVDNKGRKRTRVLDPDESLLAQASGPVES
jgi:hypothetical protein